MCARFTSSRESAEGCLPTSSSDTSPCAPSSSTPTAARSSESDETRGGSPGCTCTRETYGCSIHPSGPAEWIASQRASLARILALLDEVRASEESAAASGSRSSEQLTLFTPATSSSKTSRPSVGEAVKLSSPPYASEATGVDVGRLLRKTWARLIAGRDGGSWVCPTPSAAAEATGVLSGSKRDTWRPSLRGWALGLRPVLHSTERKRWPTPASRDWKSGASNQHGKNSRPLNEVAQRFPTPRASQPGQGDPSDPKRGKTLGFAANTFPTPRANRRGAPDSHGKRPFGGSLNPTWVEWLMGFPLGFTVCAAWATRKSPSRRHSRGSSSEVR